MGLTRPLRRTLLPAVAVLAALWPAGASPAQPAPVLSFYFAEGHIGDGFSEVLNIANFSAVDGRADIRYTFGDSPPLDAQVALFAGTTRCIALGAVGPANCLKEDRIGSPKDVSVRVATPYDWVVDRQVYFAHPLGWTGGHEQVGVAAPSLTWYFAEGTTLPEFLEYLTIQNPDADRTAEVSIDYLTEGCGGNQSRAVAVAVAPQTRGTINVRDSLGDVCVGVSSIVRSTNAVPIVVERPLYFVKDFKGDPANPASDGHDVFGVTAPSPAWYFAEGTTLPDFHQYLTLANPHPVPAEVTLHYFTDTGEAVDRQVRVQPASRYTVEVFNPARAGGLAPGITGVSVWIESSVPILAERPMYMVHAFPNAEGGGTFLVTGGHAAQGALAPGQRFSFVGATTLLNTASYLTIQNPQPATDAHLSIRYTGQSGALRTASVTVPAHTRSNVEIFNPATGGLVSGIFSPIGILVTSDTPVLVEQPSYFSLNDKDGATNVMGNPAPLDVTPPPPPVIAATIPPSPANVNTPQVVGSAEAGSTVRIYATPTCDGAALGSATAGPTGAFAVPVTVADDTPNLLFATGTDVANNTSACSEGVLYVEDSSPPAFAGPGVPVAVSGQVVLSWAPASDNFTPPSAIVYDVCRSPTAGACAASFDVAQSTPPGATTAVLGGLGSGVQYFFMVRARDQAGNRDLNTVERAASIP